MAPVPYRSVPWAVLWALPWAPLWGLLACTPPPATTSGPLPHQAYVWQRSWTPAVHEAVLDPGLERLVVLGAEVSFSEGLPRLARIPYDAATLRATGRPVGLALRIGPIPPTSASGDASEIPHLTTLAVELVTRAGEQGLGPAELHLDFDAPESRLAGYVELVRAVRAAVAPVPVTFTALPSWLRHADPFSDLAAAADGFVLQVHSLELPSRTTSTLTDPAAARRAVDRAAQFGQPFRVALPTHTYLVVLDRDGEVLDVVAEDRPRAPALNRAPDPVSPQGLGAVRWIEVPSDPTAMVRLVRGWERRRPVVLEGVIWFRLPTRDDRRAWRPETFRAVLTGRNPKPQVVAQVRRTGPAAAEIDLVNRGDGSGPPPLRLRIQWHTGKLLAGDAVSGYRMPTPGSRSGRSLELVRDEDAVARTVLQPGDRRTVAWLRWREDPGEVRAEQVGAEEVQ